MPIGFASIRSIVFGFGLAVAHMFATDVSGQVLTTQSGRAADANLVEIVNDLSMQDAYARSLFLYLQSNPNFLNNQQFYVSFVSYLLAQHLDGNCREAFSNEFERRDFFTRAFTLLPQLQQIVLNRQINRRIEVSFQLTTGQYDFTTQSLPTEQIVAINRGIQSSINSGNARNCASRILEGTEVSIETFPWSFRVVNEAGDPSAPGFPFSGALALSSQDARTLFEQFGRRLFSIVAYQVRAANDGSQRIQVIPTDAQLFGLADSAVVRVQSFAHPTLSQPNYLDISSPLTVRSEPLGLLADLQFEQQGFRAVAKGTAQGRGTGVTSAATYQIEGSAAVAGSSFIVRMTAPHLTGRIQGLPNAPGAPRFVTLFGRIAFNQATATQAPVTGRARVLEVSLDGSVRETDAFSFSGAFRAPEQNAQSDTAPEQ